ncbi:glycosyltransferase family 39 protein [bacterium]|nr:glycosyltransferase family 39 protein [bacterium]
MPDHITRCVELQYSLEHGVIFPRIFTNLCYGYSTPILNYQSPLFYYAVCLVDFLVNNITFSIKVVCALCFILSSFFMYQLVRYLWSDRAGIIAGLLYIYTPYHISQIYVRASLTEFFAVTLFPLILLHYLKYMEEKTALRFLGLSILNAVLILSHNPMALMFPPFLGAFFFYISIVEKNFRAFFNFLKPYFCGLLLSSFFLLPAIFEKQYVHFSRLTEWISDYNMHFVYFDQFFSPFWGYEYSIPGPFDGMSFQLGLFNIIALIFSIALIKKFKEREKYIVIFMTGSFFLSVFLMMFGSSIIWENFPLLSFIQYPWRFLALTGFFSSVLMGGVISVLYSEKEGTRGNSNLYLICMLIILAASQYTKGVKFTPDSLLPTTSEKIRYSGSTSSFRDEYLPVWVKKKPETIFKSVIEPSSSNIIISDLTANPLEIDFSCEVGEKEGLIKINRFYFPGWVAFLDDDWLGILYEDEYNGITHLKIPQGIHKVKLSYKGTPEQKVSFWISMVTLLSMIIYTLNDFRKKA